MLSIAVAEAERMYSQQAPVTQLPGERNSERGVRGYTYRSLRSLLCCI